MANEPTLSEFTNIQADPERGSGTPAVFLDNSDTVRMLNENARFKADNDWKKYNLFLQNFKDATKDLNEIASMDVMTEDRDALRNEMGQVFAEISKDPRGLFGGGKGFNEIQARIASLRSKSTESKLNNAFAMAHNEYMSRNPHLLTDKNKEALNQFRSQPLGARKAFTLEMPAIVDIGKLMSGIVGSPTVKQGVVSMGHSPDGNYIFEKSGHKYDLEQGRKIWNASLDTGVDENGRPFRQYAQQLFDQLTPSQKQYYNKNGGVDKLWSDIYDQQTGGKKEIYSYEKGTIKTDALAVERQRASDKLKELSAKHNYDLSLEGFKEGDREKLAKLKATLKGQSAKQQNDWLDGAVDTIVADAKANHKWLSGEAGASGIMGNTKQMYQLQVSDPILNAFAHKEKVGTKVVSVHPDNIYTDDDGNVYTQYYKRKANAPDGEILKDSKGNFIIDKQRSKQFTKNEFKTIYGKAILGTKGLNDQVKAGAASDDDGTDDGSTDDNSSDDTPPPTDTPVDLNSLLSKYGVE